MFIDINTLNANTGKSLQRGTSPPAGPSADLQNLLDQYPETAAEIPRMVWALHARYPTLPPSQVNYPDGPWPRRRPYWYYHSHYTIDKQMAVNNLQLAGRILDQTEDKYLDYLLEHSTGWSGTSSDHHNDSCFKYIQHQFHQEGELFPILDDMTWPEETPLFPSAFSPGSPWMFLLSDSTWYFIYLYDTDELLKAGKSLQDVYNGLREGRQHMNGWDGTLASMDPNRIRWETMPNTGVEYNYTDYFPDWRSLDGRRGGVWWEAIRPVEIFVPIILPELDSDDDEDCVEEK